MPPPENLHREPELREEKPQVTPSLQREKSPDPVGRDDHFEHAKENPLLRKKILVRKPFTYVDASDNVQRWDQVPAVLHVLGHDDAWVRLGKADGTPIGKAERHKLVADDWNTRQVLKPLPNCRIYRSREDAVMQQQPIDHALNLQSVVFPILGTEEGKWNVFVKVGSPLGAPYNFRDYPAWIPIRDSRGEAVADYGVLCSDNERSVLRSELTLIEMNLRTQADPAFRTSPLLLENMLHRMRSLAWRAMSGEWHRSYAPSELQLNERTKEGIFRSHVMDAKNTHIAEHDRTEFNEFLKSIRWSIEKLDLQGSQVVTEKYSLATGTGKDEQYSLINIGYIP
jgi:hypothetical protein